MPVRASPSHNVVVKFSFLLPSGLCAQAVLCSESATAEMRFALALTFVTAVFYEPLRFALTALVPWLEGELPIWHERIDASDG